MILKGDNMKNFALVLLLFTCACYLYRKNQEEDALEKITEDVLKSKTQQGLQIEIMKIPSKSTGTK